MSAKRYQSTNNKLAIIISGFSIAFVLLIVIVALATGENVRHVEALEGYTQISEEFIEEANLVAIDGYHAGTGTLNGIQHIRFVAEKNGTATDTIDVTKKFFNIVYTSDANSTDKALEGKVRAFKRTYKKDEDIKTHYYYVLYVSSSMITDVGELKS
jgi:hypothetical protein